MVSIKVSATERWGTEHTLHRSALNRPEQHTGFSTGSSRKKNFPPKPCNSKYHFPYPTYFFKTNLLKYF